MEKNTFTFARGVILTAAAFLLLITIELGLDLSGVGVPFNHLLTMTSAEARHLNNALNRNLNQLMAVAFTTVAIAVPLTANMYSLKFLEFFIKDRINAAVLTFVVFAGLNNTAIAWAIKDDFVPDTALLLSLVLVAVSVALLFPYLYYIFRFLHPNTLLGRLESEITADLQMAVRNQNQAARYRKLVSEGIEHIANIAIRSVDRADRNTAIESVFSLERVAHTYWALKPQLPLTWFEADPGFFLGFGARAVQEFTATRIWTEMKVFSQLRQVMSAAVPRMHDLVSTIAKSSRKLGLDETVSRDVALREMVVEYFNTFIRLAITRKDDRSVFTLFDQYRMLAESLNSTHPRLVEEIAYYFEYYGQMARDAGLTFLVSAIAHDLGLLVQSAYQSYAPNRQLLLERFLNYDLKTRQPLPGVKKAHAILASYLMLNGQVEQVALIGDSFHGLDRATVKIIRDELLEITREKYWEVTERRVNMDYVPDAQREQLRQFFESLEAYPT
ncbi:MAG: DUF2254 domain-containing protein [Anaerolineae bacterium]|nr:DUF2254 domain-containing protein [Anaerolineae bacterium]